MKTNELKQYRHRNDFKMEELLSVANYFIKQIAPNQPSSRVSKQLTERNVRYYINQELVDRPIGKDGLAALYEFKHLLQLIVLKRLQSSYMPVKKIAEFIKEKSKSDLFDIAVGLERHNSASSKNSALSFLNTIIESQPNEMIDCQRMDLSMMEPERSIQDIPESLLYSTKWERYTLDDGIELHIQRDFHKPINKSKIKRAIDDLFNSL